MMDTLVAHAQEKLTGNDFNREDGPVALFRVFMSRMSSSAAHGRIRAVSGCRALDEPRDIQFRLTTAN